jgi:hypothetical protein
MLWNYLIAMLAIPVLLLGWLLVQQAARRVAAAHPEMGPAREEGGTCGTACGCEGQARRCRKSA